ncbi:hypothetical protein F8388_023794 [Cannabis sativa]|uniref:Rx N-terminal domain-containing protein n=1 Tax=Cannabis sativa TaxID=3483 RepID=A0A7J6GA68_CANSA|nr:hypothetical protein F8388_023794 [Cannabis sativa]
MAEAVLTVVLENLSSLIQKQVGSVLGVEKEMEKMCSIFSTISAVLEDAEERQSTNRSIKNWLQKLEYVSAELEDVLDDCEAEAFRLEEGLAQHHSWIRKVQSSLSYLSPKHISFRHAIAKKIKEIEDRLDQIGKERSILKLQEVDVVERRNRVRESRQSIGSIITQPHVYGREEDKERVVGDVKVLPDSICLLHHLLTLDLTKCLELRKLPKHMIRLKGLRHLYIGDCWSLSHLPPNIGKLSCLKTLTDFIVDKRKGCQLDELKDLNIGGDLHISNLENVIMSPVEARFANLSAKRNLKRLHLSWENNENISEENAKDVLEALAPPTSLKWLEIHKYNGVHFPSWFRDDILTSLRRLKICNMDLVEYIDNRGDLRSSFGCLESLEIWSLPNLEGFSRHDQVGNEMFPSLSSLYVRECPKLRLPKLGSVKSLRVYGVSQQLLESISNLCGGLIVLPEGLQHLCSLESLQIFDILELASLPDWLGNLTTLKDLRISTCRDLECIPMSMQRLTNLKKLSIWSCPKLGQRCEKEVGEDWHKISHIPHVDMMGCVYIFSLGIRASSGKLSTGDRSTPSR